MTTPSKERKKAVKENKVLNLQERMELARREVAAMEKEVKELLAWTDMIEGMDDSDLKHYVKNRPKSLKMTKREKIGMVERSRSGTRGVKKGKRSIYSGIMASVWKFHKEDQ